MKWGDRYDYNYVNNLYSSIKTHTKNKTELICFNDNDENIVRDVICKQLHQIKIRYLIFEN